MHIPDLTIECLRCTAFAILDTTGAQKDERGDWKPAGTTRRPSDWMASPSALFDMTRGICPRCVPDWLKMQELFLSMTPTDPAIEVRQPISVAPKTVAKIASYIPIQPVISTHIPIRNDQAAPRESCIPSVAVPVEQPQVTQTALPPGSQRHAPQSRGVIIAPTRAVMPAPAPSRATVMVSPVPCAKVTASPISSQGQAVRVSSSPHGGYVAPASVQKIPIRAPAVHATPLATTHSHAAAPHSSLAQAPGGSHGKMVTVSAPQPIQSELSPFKAVVTDMQPIAKTALP